MIDFNIRRGLSTVLFSSPGVVNSNIVIEEGCWYLCTDTAELFLGIHTEDGLALKRINELDENYTEVIEALGSEINTIKENLTGYAKKTDIIGLATEQYVDDAITNHEVLTEVKTKLETEVLPIIPTVQETILPTVQKVETEIIPTVQELTEKAATQEWVQKQSFATETFVEEKISEIKIPEAEIYKVDFNAPDYAKAVEAYNNGKVLVLINAAPDINSYAVMNYVSEKYIAFTKFLMSRSETYGAFNTYYLSPANTWEVSKEVKLNKVEITADGNLQVGKQIFEAPSIEGLATEEFVNKKIAEAELADKEADLEAYYTKSEVNALIPDTSKFITEVPVEYVTEDELAAKGYLTEHQSLEGYAKKSELFSGSYNDLSDKPEIPRIEGLATEEFVRTEIEKIDVPTIDTSNLVTTEIFNSALTTKADKVLFTTAKFVKNPAGDFVKNEDISSLTIAELFAKLLGLSDAPTEDPVLPEDPEIPQGIIQTILTNRLPIYQIDESAVLQEVPYCYYTYTLEASAQLGEATGFYQVKDGTTVTESGYEHQTNPQEMYYMIAIPSELTLGENVTVMAWDEGLESWNEIDAVAFINDYSEIDAALAEADLSAPTLPDGYTLWADLNDINSGMKYRFIINEEA